MNNFNDIVAQFYTAATKYSAGIQPYALKLFVALLLIDIVVTWIQLLSGGFVYLMIVNAFPWMNAVVKSFSAIGAAVTGLPALSPQTVLQLGANMASTIFDAPANTSLMTNLELAIVQSVAAFFVLLSFVVATGMLILTLIEAYLVVGGGVILLGLGANRFTAPAAEGYFGYVIRVGVRLLFFYLVLAVGVQMASQWSAALAAACKPVSATLPWWTTYGVPPGSIVTTVCSGSLSVSTMLTYAALSIIFMIVTVSVPHMAAGIAGGTIGLALSHAFEAAFIARTVIRPITSALQAGFNKVSQIGSGNGASAGDAPAWLNAMELGRRTQRLANADANTPPPRVPAPKNVRATSVIQPHAPKTTPIDPSTSTLPKANGTVPVGKPTTRI